MITRNSMIITIFWQIIKTNNKLNKKKYILNAMNSKMKKKNSRKKILKKKKKIMN